MHRHGLALISAHILLCNALNLEYLDPTKLQTKTPETEQQETAANIISKYTQKVQVVVNPSLFRDNKDHFVIQASEGKLNINASTGVAALWGFNYYLKKYCKNHIGWQVQNIAIPDPLPDADEEVTANDRFRYYENVCTVSYSFVWWKLDEWRKHVEWMALNGINLALAPVAQEAAWAEVYKELGMTNDEINEHFTGPAFLSWLRMGNLRGWLGPLFPSWHSTQKEIQHEIINYMYKLGIIPVFPAFNGHVPKAFSRIFPSATFYSTSPWNRFQKQYCCGLFLHPSEPLFRDVGTKFLKQISNNTTVSNIYTADSFNEIYIKPWSTELVKLTAENIFKTLSDFDNNAVWLLQNWMFVSAPVLWSKDRVRTFMTSVPNGRLLVLDLQSEQWPQYDLYEMYYGQPFLWSMLHNFGGTLGMFGNMVTINKDVYEVRHRVNTTMIGIGITPEGINQNYVVYELMLESAWRQSPVVDLEVWAGDYAERRYGCNDTATAWKYLIRSVYSFNGLNRVRGKYVPTRRPSFKITPWAWYNSEDLLKAFQEFAFVPQNSCISDGFNHDLVDVTRQALQYRTEQLYLNIARDRFSDTWVFNASIHTFLDAINDLESILATNKDFTITNWLAQAKSFGANPEEIYNYEINARNQITLWGPNGEISDYAGKQWAEVFHYYYIPRWTSFLTAALDAKIRQEIFNEKNVQNVIREIIENQFQFVRINQMPVRNPKSLAVSLYEKWANLPGVQDLPLNIIRRDNDIRPIVTTLSYASTDIDTEDIVFETTAEAINSTTPSYDDDTVRMYEV